MHTIRTVTGTTLAEMLHPPFRRVDYADDAAVLTVSTRLRQAWATSPALIAAPGPGGPAASPGDGVGQIIRAIQSASPEELARARNPDKDAVHTPLRDSIYHSWNHVFWDVSRFLQDAACGTGHLHPPSESVLAVEYPEEPREGRAVVDVVEKTWETSVLLAPTFLEEGVKLRFEIGEMEGCGGEDGSGFVFDATGTKGVYNETEVYWVRRGERVRISIGGDYGKERAGVAAVFVCGMLCDCVPESEEAQEEEETSENGNGKRKRDGDDGEDGHLDERAETAFD
ncbi:hypothetical protein UCRNP2_10431 [Neofusicoccum parvum UCRNP2]|uniref:Uncharacterized protein n=2 Tax=Neofusicoccum parvum TaxID=310453 RepID=R1E5D9_BOTPV|nr:hypothetical protein UCRNP2_10431 [Neofusicoccum parvum UCRNP2]GME44855.1 hypothetical protein GTA08_BOTSDO07875 [Neofusicoccum parvum]